MGSAGARQGRSRGSVRGSPVAFMVPHRGGPRQDVREARVTAPPTMRAMAWEVAVVRGRSMEPTLRDGDRLLVRSGQRGARPGRLVVVALPDGRPVAVKRLVRREPDGGWWVERDNPREGVDSWQVGALPEAAVLGVVVARLWPRPGRLPRDPHDAAGARRG